MPSDPKYRRTASAFVQGVLHQSACLCGESDPEVLQFDHTDPTEKSLGIARMVGGGYSISAIKEEMDKTQILCANCHARKTAKEQEWYATT